MSWAVVVLLSLLVLAADSPLFDIAAVQKESRVGSRSFQTDTCFGFGFYFAHHRVLIN